LQTQKTYVYIDDSDIHGKGIFTVKDIPVDTKLFLVADLERYYDGLQWITKSGRLVNHQKNGNCILKKEGSCFFIYSCRNIKADEELTSDYTLLPKPFKNTVTGYKELTV
jgi:SET domain-containing protein